MGWPKLPKIKLDNRSVEILRENLEDARVVMETIAVVAAAALLLPDGSDAFVDPDVKIYSLYQAASDKLEELSNIDEVVNTSSPGDQITSSGRLLGCWFNPTTSEVDMRTNHDLYNDLASFLTISGVPANFKYNGTLQETAMILAQTAFETPPPVVTVGGDNIKGSLITIPNPENDCIIQIRYAHYRLNLGKRAPTTAWHSCIQVQTTATTEFHKAQLAKQPGRVIDPPQRVIGDLKWKATVKVGWATAAAAEDAGQNVPGQFLQQNPDYAIARISVIGLGLLLQIEGPIGATPSKIESKVSVAVSNFTANESSGGEGRLLLLPKVDLVSSIPVEYQ